MAASLLTRERLIAAAQDILVSNRGELDMQSLAKQTGVSVGLAYYHFRSKAGLIAAVVESFYASLEQAVFGPPRWPAATWAERERGRIGAYIAFHYAHPFAPLVIGPLSRAPEVLEVEQVFTARQLDGGARMLSAAQSEGVVPGDLDPDLTIALMIGGIRQALILAMTGTQRPPPDQLERAIWAFIAPALRLPAPSAHQPLEP